LSFALLLFQNLLIAVVLNYQIFFDSSNLLIINPSNENVKPAFKTQCVFEIKSICSHRFRGTEYDFLPTVNVSGTQVTLTVTSKNEAFQLLNHQLELVKQQRENTQMSLNLKTFQQESEQRREESKRFDEISSQPTSLNIAALKSDLAEMKGDTAKISRSDRWLKDLNRDIFLEEAVRVIGDWR